jgi:hypothetical protein
MHIARMYRIMGDDDAQNIFATLKTEQWVAARKTVVSTVLATDMVHHFNMVTEIELFLELHEEQDLKQRSTRAALFANSDKQTRFLLNLFMHAADISNPAKRFDVCERWAGCVMEEFFCIGDEERRRDLPVSPMFDRHDTLAPQVQVNFIEFVVGPLFAGMGRIFPELKPLGRQVCVNRRIWGEKWMAALGGSEAERREQREKNEGRFGAFVKRFGLTVGDGGVASGCRAFAPFARCKLQPHTICAPRPQRSF